MQTLIKVNIKVHHLKKVRLSWTPHWYSCADLTFSYDARQGLSPSSKEKLCSYPNLYLCLSWTTWWNIKAIREPILNFLLIFGKEVSPLHQHTCSSFWRYCVQPSLNVCHSFIGRITNFSFNDSAQDVDLMTSCWVEQLVEGEVSTGIPGWHCPQPYLLKMMNLMLTMMIGAHNL